MNEAEILELLQEDPQTPEEKLSWTFRATKFLLILQLEQIRVFKLVKKVALIILVIIASKFGIDYAIAFGG